MLDGSPSAYEPTGGFQSTRAFTRPTSSALRRRPPEEYLAFERASEVKHEYADGEVFAMSGGTFEHSACAA